MPYTDEKLKVLGQLSPVANTLTAIYTVPAGKDCTISSIVVTNRDGAAGSTFSISIAIAGAADDVKQYIYYNLPIPQTETFIATVGFSLSTGDVVRVKSGNGSMSFSLFGTEVTY